MNEFEKFKQGLLFSTIKDCVRDFDYEGNMIVKCSERSTDDLKELLTQASKEHELLELYQELWKITTCHITKEMKIKLDKIKELENTK